MNWIRKNNPYSLLTTYYLQQLWQCCNARPDPISFVVALTHFNTKSVASMPVPVPPLEEQNQIVAEVERRLSVEEELEKEVKTNLQRSERLRQAILSHAFSGRLMKDYITILDNTAALKGVGS